MVQICNHYLGHTKCLWAHGPLVYNSWTEWSLSLSQLCYVMILYLMKYHYIQWADVHTSTQSNVTEELILLYYNSTLKTKLKTNKQNPTQWFLIFHPTCFNSFCYSELSSIQSCLALKPCSAHSRQPCLHIDVMCSFISLCIFFLLHFMWPLRFPLLSQSIPVLRDHSTHSKPPCLITSHHWTTFILNPWGIYSSEI